MDLWCGFHTFRIRECQVRFPEMCVTWSRCVVNIINSACICLLFRGFCNFDSTSTKEKQQTDHFRSFQGKLRSSPSQLWSAAEAIFRVSGLSLLSLPVICNILAKRMLWKCSNKCVRWKCPESMICSQTSHLAHAINGEWPHELTWSMRIPEKTLGWDQKDWSLLRVDLNLFHLLFRLQCESKSPLALRPVEQTEGPCKICFSWETAITAICLPENLLSWVFCSLPGAIGISWVRIMDTFS